MANHVHIEGVAPYNGDYPLDVSYFKNRELHIIKQIANVRAGELEDAFDNDDNDLLVAFAVIALQRAGLKVDIDAIWDAPVGKISLVIDGEADADPPASAPSNAPDVSANGGEKIESSGPSGRSDGDGPPANSPNSTGSPV